jgi:hypothetical protein
VFSLNQKFGCTNLLGKHSRVKTGIVRSQKNEKPIPLKTDKKLGTTISFLLSLRGFPTSQFRAILFKKNSIYKVNNVISKNVK